MYAHGGTHEENGDLFKSVIGEYFINVCNMTFSNME